ncbi:MAG: IS1 family transposase [Planctomycetes bacterium]|nr:IS1 family transposase [Planctomycetota bacterium]
MKISHLRLTRLICSSIMVSMNRLDMEKRCQIVSALVEGCSIRSTVRMTGASKNTIAKLLADLGQVCSDYQDEVIRDLACKRLQCDEIWSFCYAKNKNVPEKMKGQKGVGDVWTWTALCPDTKLVPSWQVGARDAATAYRFMSDLSERLAHRVQLTTDGNRVYLDAVENYFGCDIDYAMLIKHYGGAGDSTKPETRYSPGNIVRTSSTTIMGNPDKEHVSTSLVERQNLTMRMKMRRFTRLTNGFSKKIENHCHAVSIHFMHYNFARIHQTIRCAPAMAAGVSRKLWSIKDIVGLLETREAKQGAANERDY